LRANPERDEFAGSFPVFIRVVHDVVPVFEKINCLAFFGPGVWEEAISVDNLELLPLVILQFRLKLPALMLGLLKRVGGDGTAFGVDLLHRVKWAYASVLTLRCLGLGLSGAAAV